MVEGEEEDMGLAGDTGLVVVGVGKGNVPEGDKVLGLDRPRFE